MEENDKQKPAHEAPVLKTKLQNFSQPTIVWKPDAVKVEIPTVVRPGREENESGVIKD